MALKNNKNNPKACNYNVGTVQLPLILASILEQVSWFRQTAY